MRLAQTGDLSRQAACRRFRAAVHASGYAQQKAFAAALGIRGVTSVNNVFKERQFPSRDMIAVLFQGHRVDFNFVLAGQFSQLPGDLQDALFAALADDPPPLKPDGAPT
jgi:hypothetical protein